MYSAIAFILTATEVGAVCAAFSLQLKVLFLDLVVYGSPIYMIQNAIGAGSILHEKNLLFIGFLGFHLIKYAMIIQAQRLEERNIMRALALMFEALYIVICAYYLL